MSATRVYKLNSPNGVVGIDANGDVTGLRVAFISDTAANNAARVLDPGEGAVDTITKRLRIGDGVTAGGDIGEIRVSGGLYVGNYSFLASGVIVLDSLRFADDSGLRSNGSRPVFTDIDATEFPVALVGDLSSYLTTASAASTYTPVTRTISTTSPLTGGGDLSANRTLAIPAATASANGYATSTQITKLDGIATGATANSSDATLLARANHTGTQAQSTITSLVSDLALKAPLASPALTGTPTAPTAAAATNTTQLATTAFVTTADNLKANAASPAFTGAATHSGTSATTLYSWTVGGNQIVRVIHDGAIGYVDAQMFRAVPIGGASGSAYQVWKDTSPSKAVAFGMNVPGGGITDDIVFSIYDGGSWAGRAYLKSATGNMLIGTSTDPLERLAVSGRVYLANQADPSTPTGGGVLYVSSGALKYKGSSGTITTIAPA